MEENTGSVLYLTKGGASGTPFHYSLRRKGFFNSLKAHCLSHKVSLEVLGVQSFSQFRAALPGCMPTLGFIVWICKLDDPNQILKHLSGLGLPVAVYDENGDQQPPICEEQSAPIQFFTLSGEKAGAQIAAFLLSKGHQKVAFFSPYHHNQWSINRLNGLRMGYEQAGAFGGVEAYLIVPKEMLVDSQFNGDGHIHYLPMSSALSKASTFLPPEEGLNGEERKKLNDFLTALSEREELQIILRPAFREAFRFPGITAWVGANDFISRHAQRFLLDKSIEIPADIAVIGYDNNPLTIEYNLSSYDINLPLAAEKALDFVMNPSSYPAKDSIVVDGFIAEREST